MIGLMLCESVDSALAAPRTASVAAFMRSALTDSLLLDKSITLPLVLVTFQPDVRCHAGRKRRPEAYPPDCPQHSRKPRYPHGERPRKARANQRQSQCIAPP